MKINKLDLAVIFNCFNLYHHLIKSTLDPLFRALLETYFIIPSIRSFCFIAMHQVKGYFLQLLFFE